MLEDPFSQLSFIAGPAIPTNARAIMQNGATIRYSLAVIQWREFHAALSIGNGRITQKNLDGDAALTRAGRRVRLQLRGLGPLNAAVALFVATTVLGLAGAFLVQLGALPAAPVGVLLVSAGSTALLLLAATRTFLRKRACGRALLVPHRNFRETSDAEQPRGSVGNAI